MLIWDTHHLHQQYLKGITTGIFKNISPPFLALYFCLSLYLYLGIPYLRIIVKCGHSSSSGVPNS